MTSFNCFCNHKSSQVDLSLQQVDMSSQQVDLLLQQVDMSLQVDLLLNQKLW